MKKIVVISMALVLLTVTLFAKDINAWKTEPNLEQQYNVFKKNLDYWDGKYIVTGAQLDQFNAAFSDSVAALENEVAESSATINELQNELRTANTQLKNTQSELDTSVKNQNAIEVFGLNVEKGVYTLFVSLIIMALIIALGVIFMFYKRSNAVTVKYKNDYKDLKEELETHKKSALERYTKLNMELHQTRMELKNKSFN